MKLIVEHARRRCFRGPPLSPSVCFYRLFEAVGGVVGVGNAATVRGGGPWACQLVAVGLNCREARSFRSVFFIRGADGG